VVQAAGFNWATDEPPSFGLGYWAGPGGGSGGGAGGPVDENTIKAGRQGALYGGGGGGGGNRVTGFGGSMVGGRGRIGMVMITAPAPSPPPPAGSHRRWLAESGPVRTVV